MERFSKLTIGLGIFIIISASFMLQVRRFFIEMLGNEALKISLISLFFIIFILYFLYIIKNRLPLYAIGMSFLVFATAYIVMAAQPFFAEKLHILEYGLLGYLALRDLSKEDKYKLKNVLGALFFTASIGIMDEYLQWLLPYRVFEIRDISTNVVSGALGIIQYLVYRSGTG